MKKIFTTILTLSICGVSFTQLVKEQLALDVSKAEAENIEKALQLSVAYTYMSKGQLLGFFLKAMVTENDDIIELSAENVYV